MDNFDILIPFWYYYGQFDNLQGVGENHPWNKQKISIVVNFFKDRNVKGHQ